MLSTVETEPTPPRAVVQAPPRQGLRVAALVAAGVVALFCIVLLAYELAVARVPQHRAALERLVRAQTGLDIRFDELGLRWGWYGPEAVFRRVELGEPGRSAVLRAPELVVGFDVWQTLRSGQLEAARITLVAADIDLSRGAARAPAETLAAGRARREGGASSADGAARRGDGASTRGSARDRNASDVAPVADGVRLLEGWQGGRVDLEGGTLRLADPGGSANPLVLQIRRASLRRSELSSWSGYGLVFLPERLGRTARLVLRLDGDLERPAGLSGTVRFEGRRLVFSGWRELLAAVPGADRYLPRAGSGDLTLNVDFASGRVSKASGKVTAGGLEFAAPGEPGRVLVSLDHVRGEWRLAQRDPGWRLRVDSLELGNSAGRAPPASLSLDAAPAGEWVRGNLEQAPLQTVAALARWFAPQLDLSGVELGGTVRNVTFDWNGARPSGQRLQTAARLVDVSIAPPGRGFTLTGLAGEISGDEVEQVAELKTRTARLELAQAPQYPLDDVRVDARLQIGRAGGAWRIATEKLELQHGGTRLRVEGSLSGDGSLYGGGSLAGGGVFVAAVPEINAHAELTGADVTLLEKLAGASMAQAFGATFSQLTAGRIDRAQIELRGPFAATLPDTGFTGSLLLRDAVLSGGALWPDAHGVDARIDWRGPRIHAYIEKGQAGSFELSATKADWDVRGERIAHITGHVSGAIEDAIAWMRSHPKLQQYAPRVQNIEMRGAASLDFNLALPPGVDASTATASDIQAHVIAVLEGARLEAVAGMPPMDALRGTLVFDSGYLRRSTLVGTWLGGPVTLNVGERRERGALVLSIQGHGVMNARHLARAATAGTVIDETLAPAGNAEWSGELAYLAGNDSRPAHWRVRADSSLVGVVSHLPEPLMKGAATAVPLHVEAQGTADEAQLRLSLGDRLRGVLALTGHDDATWRVERGNVQFGSAAAVLPREPVVLVEGRLGRLDLPAYVAAWQQLRDEPAAAPIRADLVAGEMLVAGRGYADVRVLAERTEAGADLQLVAADITGTAHWPAVTNSSHPAQFHFARLNVPDGGAFAASAELIAALGPATELSVDDIVWEGHSLGSASATIESGGNAVDITDLRMIDRTQEVNATVHCQSTACRLKFNLDSTNAAATLADFGFRPDLTAAKATVEGDLEWRVGADQPALATLAGRLNLRLEDGMTRTARDPDAEGTPFALLLVPALMSGIDQAVDSHALRFSRLEGDFELSGGEATTSNLHLDGDAEILMRGRTGLVARDYDQQVWILRGEGRLPAAVRRLGPTPRVAAAWLSLREIFAGARGEEGSRASLHLQGSWADPIVVATD
ncbi:MAG TPA: AsmA-like C-terminal region-containing protein [Steroidobacteraceae bacterium]|nr:AsmA-like C-terminal region-containing protein [Steroidobacteraceae bacterium]